MIPGGLIATLLGTGFTAALTIAAPTNNYDVAVALAAAGWDGTTVVDVSVTINAGITVSATSTANAAFKATTLPGGSVLRLTNNGNIYGFGGAGGVGGTNTGNGTAGSMGGKALEISCTAYIDNLSGTIKAGSGGNGGSAATRTGGTSGTTSAGCTGSLECIGASCSNGFCNSNTGATGSTGATGGGAAGSTGGAGANASYGTSRTCSGVCSGPGCNGIVSCTKGTPGAGGPVGNAVVGNSFITWINTGVRTGGIV